MDDSSTMRRIIVNRSSKLGYRREGSGRLSAAPVDLVTTGWHMPQMNGIDFIGALRELDR